MHFQTVMANPLSSLYIIQPNENQSALESYATPLANTSGAIYPCVPLDVDQIEISNQKYWMEKNIEISKLSTYTLACGFFFE